jgi:hypothetical protein
MHGGKWAQRSKSRNTQPGRYAVPLCFAVIHATNPAFHLFAPVFIYHMIAGFFFFFFFFLESAFIERYRQVLVPRCTVLQLSKTVRMSVVGTGSCKMYSQVLHSLVVIWFGKCCGPKAEVVGFDNDRAINRSGKEKPPEPSEPGSK